jgi:hypothetical protein
MTSGRLRAFGPLMVGAIALLGATVVATQPALLEAIVEPPPAIRAVLVVGSAALGVALLLRAVDRLAAAAEPAAEELPASAGPADTNPDVRGMIRAVRLVFLAIAAFAATIGWILGEALPLVAAAIIAGVDVLETSFLLLVVTVRGGPNGGGPGNADPGA